MNNKRMRRKQLPVLAVLILTIGAAFEFVGVYRLANYINLGNMTTRDLLTHTGHFVLLLIIVTAAMILLLRKLADVMYNRDSITQVANSDKMGEFAYKLALFGNLSNYTVLFMNIKDMRTINARYGKDGGDIIMREYALLLMRTLGKKNYVGRLGGDNFIIYVRNDNADTFIKYLKGVIVDADIEGVKVHATIKVRCGIYTAKDGDSPHTVMNNASLALAAARASQGKDFIWYEPWMAEEMMKKRMILTEFERSILEDVFIINYQPKFNIKDRKVCGAEALVTWKRPDGETIHPDEFISALEQFGKISELDFFMLKAVCKDIKRWELKGLKPVRVSVNFSRENLNDSNFAGRVLSIIDEYKVAAQYIEIEITESFSNRNEVALADFISKMKDRGIKTAVDDFGVGYSSLSVIPNLDFDVIKLDKSFLRGVEEKRQREFVMSIVKMLNNLGFEVVCEGIENEEQAQLLEIAGCRVGQGYLFSKNLSVEEFENML